MGLWAIQTIARRYVALQVTEGRVRAEKGGLWDKNRVVILSEAKDLLFGVRGKKQVLRARSARSQDDKL